jgi:hypothetical protein
MRKELNMGTTAEERAVSMRFSSLSFPKSRTTRPARRRRRIVMGSWNGPSAIKEASTTIVSRRFHRSLMNRVNQCPYALMSSSTRKIKVKKMSR